MELKQIEIIGFKSFGDKVVLPFNKEEWITSIVGPNGCGKSNIADAFQWVLGNQSPKEMRAAERVDVIFSGTTKRKPLNFAEVTLIFVDNENHLPLDYTSVAVTRRMYRNGESDYLINRHPVRLKDIHDLFLDSGLGKNSYAIMKQGKMDELIHLSPNDRRDIFMKAAGIERFMEKKAESEKKLKEADANMGRVQQLLDDVEQQKLRLEKDVGKAKTYEGKKEEAEHLGKSIFFTRWGDVEKKVQTLTSELDEKTQLCLKEEKRLQEQTLRRKEQQESTFSLQDQMQEGQEVVVRLIHRKEFCRKEQEREKERQQERKQQKQRLEKEKDESLRERGQREKEKEDAEKKILESEQRVSLARESLHEVENKLEEIRADYQDWRQQIRQKTQEKMQAMEKEASLNREKQKGAWQRENEEKRLAELQKNLLAGHERHDELLSKKSTEESSFEKKEKEIATLQETIDDLEQTLEEIQKEWEQLFASSQKEERDLSRLRARHEILERMQLSGEGLSSGAQKLLQEAAKEGSPLYGKLKPLYEVIRPKKEQEQAVAQLMQRYSHTLVIETEEGFWQVIAFCRMEEITEFSVICQEMLPSSSRPSTNPFSEKVRPHDLASHLLDSILVVDFLDEAILKMAEDSSQEVWCEEGILIDQKGVMMRRALKETDLFLREAEIEELGQLIEVAEASHKEQKKAVEAAEKRKKEKQDQMRVLENSLKEQQVHFAEQRSTLRHLIQEEESLSKLIKEWKEQIFTTEKKLALAEEESRKVEGQLAEARDRREAIERDLTGMDEDGEKQFREVARWEEEKKSREKRMQTLLEEQRKWVHVTESLMIQGQEAKKGEERWRQRWLEIEKEVDHSETVQRELKAELESLVVEEESAQRVWDDGKRKAEEGRQQLQHLEEEIRQRTEKKKEVDRQQQQLEIALAEQRTWMEELEREKEALFDGAFSPHQASMYVLDRDLEVAERRLRRLRQELSSMNDINMNAAKDYQESAEKAVYLQHQIEDYQQSREQFAQIIANLEGESRKKFRITFANIRNHFQRNFSLLFGGGEADLLLTDSKDLLTGGIEIVARPPGKQMRSISLLSGGEKCMTAIALLFALFEEKPSPFCLLDEIDAPLDEANVDRFLNILKKFEDRCQFIIITHNKRTMKIANRIIGVSMEEQGVSKVLMMKMASEKQEPVVI